MDIVGTAVGSILAVTILGYWVTSGSGESEQIQTAQKAVEVAQDAATKAVAAAEVKPELAPVAAQVQAKAEEAKAVVEEAKAEGEVPAEEKQAKEAAVAAAAAAAAAAAVVTATETAKVAETEAPKVTPEEAKKVAEEETKKAAAEEEAVNTFLDDTSAAGTGLLTQEQMAANSAIPSTPSTPGSTSSRTSDPGSIQSRPSNISIPFEHDAVDGTTLRRPRPDLGEEVRPAAAPTVTAPAPALGIQEPEIILDEKTSIGVRLSSEQYVQDEVDRYFVSQGFVTEDKMIYNHPTTKANVMVNTNGQDDTQLHVLVSTLPDNKQAYTVPLVNGLMSAVRHAMDNQGFTTPANGAARRRRRVTRNRRRRRTPRRRQITLDDLVRLLKK